MKNNEMKEYKTPEKNVKDMSNLEIINEQITRIISKLNDRTKGVDVQVEKFIYLSEELRELVMLRDELERIENLRKQREEFKIKKVEIVEDHREKRKKFLGK